MLFWIVAFVVSVVKYRYWAWLPDFVPELMWVFAAIQVVLDSMNYRVELNNQLEKEKYVIDKAFENGLVSADNFKIEFETDAKKE